MKLMSIIIPVYNCEKYISKCINSIINSYKHDDLEVIIVNDGSKDNSEEIIKMFMKKDKRIKMINKKNSGPSAARNRGILEARGYYLMFVDADDFLDKDTLMKFRNILISKKYDTIIFNYKKCNRDDQVKKNESIFTDDYVYYKKNKREIYKKLVSTSVLNHPVAKFYSSEIIKNNNIYFKEDIRVGEDRIFNMKYFYYSQKGIYKDLYLYKYRYNPESLTKTFNISKFSDLKQTHIYRMEYIKKYNLKKNIKNSAENFTFKSLFSLIKIAIKNNISYKQLEKIIKDPLYDNIINKCKIYGFKDRFKKIILKNKLFSLLEFLVKMKIFR